MLALLLTASALAQSADTTVVRPRPVAGHAILDLRVGVDQFGPGQPFVCGELYPLAWLSVEGCGTGSGLWQQQADRPELAHFRARAKAAGFGEGRATMDLLVGAGFAELQRGVDEPGFRFGQPTEPSPVEAAGPEVSVSAKGRYWADRGARTYLTADLNAGLAVIPGAPAVMGGGGPTIPFTSLTLGFGF